MEGRSFPRPGRAAPQDFPRASLVAVRLALQKTPFIPPVLLRLTYSTSFYWKDIFQFLIVMVP